MLQTKLVTYSVCMYVGEREINGKFKFISISCLDYY